MGKFLNIFKVSDLRKKVFIILGILGITRLLAAIPVPGIDTSRLQELFSSNQLFGFLKP
jgi:preprotein translocase subunit SecY